MPNVRTNIVTFRFLNRLFEEGLFYLVSPGLSGWVFKPDTGSNLYGLSRGGCLTDGIY